jgi:hypothetical protein
MLWRGGGKMSPYGIQRKKFKWYQPGTKLTPVILATWEAEIGKIMVLRPS